MGTSRVSVPVVATFVNRLPSTHSDQGRLSGGRSHATPQGPEARQRVESPRCHWQDGGLCESPVLSCRDGRGECSCEPRAAPRDRLHPCQRCDPCITWAEAHSPRQDCQRSRAAGSGAASRLPCKQGWTWRTCMVGSLVASPDAGCAFGAPGIPQGELHSFRERGGGLLEKLMNSPKALSALWTPRSFGAWRGQCGRAQQA